MWNIFGRHISSGRPASDDEVKNIDFDKKKKH